MTPNAVVQMGLYLAVLLACVKPLGLYMARVYAGNAPCSARICGPLERLLYRLGGIDQHREMTCRQYAIALLMFSFVSFVAVYGLQRVQDILPANPESLPRVAPDSSFNTAVSFVTNTNWQGYGGESTMSYLTQMLALTVQNFVSAAAGMAVLVAFLRGFTRCAAATIGNFWVDLVRGTLYILLAAVAGAIGGPGIAGRRSNAVSISRGDASGADARCGRSACVDAAYCRGACGFADCDQATGDQRRRFLQRQLGASVREPHAAVQLP